jgi:hypothetical protein
MSKQMKLQVKGAEIGATQIGGFKAPVSMVVVADSIDVGEIKGNANLSSVLTNGKLGINFNLIFSPKLSGCGLKSLRTGDNVGLDQIKDLMKLGLTQKQARDVIGLIRQHLTNSISNLQVSSPEYVIPSGIKGKKNNKPGFEVVAIPLPDVPINGDSSIEIKNVSIKNINLSSVTTVSSDSINLADITLDDFDVLTSQPDFFNMDEAEIDGFRIPPQRIPSFGLNNFATDVFIPRLGATSIPLSLQSTGGSADLTLVDWPWRPRWTWGFSLDLGVCTLKFSLIFGFDLRITVTYTWVLTSLKVVVSIMNAFVNNLRVSIKFASILLTDVRLGLLSFARLLYSPVSAMFREKTSKRPK